MKFSKVISLVLAGIMLSGCVGNSESSESSDSSESSGLPLNSENSVNSEHSVNEESGSGNGETSINELNSNEEVPEPLSGEKIAEELAECFKDYWRGIPEGLMILPKVKVFGIDGFGGYDKVVFFVYQEYKSCRAEIYGIKGSDVTKIEDLGCGFEFMLSKENGGILRTATPYYMAHTSETDYTYYRLTENGFKEYLQISACFFEEEETSWFVNNGDSTVTDITKEDFYKRKEEADLEFKDAIEIKLDDIENLSMAEGYDMNIDGDFAGYVGQQLGLTEAKYASHEIQFPASELGRNENTEELFSIDPFTLSIDLPENWNTKVVETAEGLTGGFSPVDIITEDGAVIATIDFNIFTPPETTGDSDPSKENYYRMVYNQLMLGSTVNWDFDYTPVKSGENYENAVCRVMYLAHLVTIYKPGILAYNNKLGAYINIDFKNQIADDTLKQIAYSISLD